MLSKITTVERTILGVPNSGVGEATIDGEVFLQRDPVADNEGVSRRYAEGKLSAHEAEAGKHLSASDRSLLAGLDTSSVDAKLALLAGLTGEVESQLSGLLKLSGGDITGQVLQTRGFGEGGNSELLTKDGVDTNLFPLPVDLGSDVGEVKVNLTSSERGTDSLCDGSLVLKSDHPDLALVVDNEHDTVAHSYTTTAVASEEYINTVENVATTVTGALVFEDVVTQVSKVVKVPRTVTTYVNTTVNVTKSCMLVGIEERSASVAQACGYNPSNSINMTNWYKARGSDLWYDMVSYYDLLAAANNMVSHSGAVMPKPPFVITMSRYMNGSETVICGFVFTSPSIQRYEGGVEMFLDFEDAHPYINLPGFDGRDPATDYFHRNLYPIDPVTWQETVSTPVYTTVYDDVTVVENVVTKVPVMIDKTTTTIVYDSVPRIVSSYVESVYSLGGLNCDIYHMDKENYGYAFGSGAWSLDQCRRTWAGVGQNTRDWVKSIPSEAEARYSGLRGEDNSSWCFQIYNGPLNIGAWELHNLVDSGCGFPRLIKHTDGTPLCFIMCGTWNYDNSGPRYIVETLARYGLYDLYLSDGGCNFPPRRYFSVKYRNSTLVQTTVYDQVPRTVTTTTKVQKTEDTIIQVPTFKTQIVQNVRQSATWTQTSDNPTPVTHFRLPKKPVAMTDVELVIAN